MLISKEENVFIYPNSTNGKILIRVVHDPAKFIIFNSLGKWIPAPALLIKNSDVILVDLEKEPGGIYFIKTAQGIKKVVKE